MVAIVSKHEPQYVECYQISPYSLVFAANCMLTLSIAM